MGFLMMPNYFYLWFEQKSLEILGLSADEILSIFKVIAVVLKLGNLSFIPTTNIDGTEGCEVSDEYGKDPAYPLVKDI